MEICKSNGNKICYNIKKNTDVIEDKDIDTDTESLTAVHQFLFIVILQERKEQRKILILENFL